MKNEYDKKIESVDKILKNINSSSKSISKFQQYTFFIFFGLAFLTLIFICIGIYFLKN